MSNPRDADDADDGVTRAATPPAGSGELPRLGPAGGPPEPWVGEDATGRTGWVQAQGKAEWVKKPKSQEGWVERPGPTPTPASGSSAEEENTLVFDAPTVAEVVAASAGSKRRLGDFELERKVGQGGMGEVWLARQVSLDRPVAVKVLPKSLANQDNFIERFQREAKAAASLVHPNVLQIYSFGVSEGTPYFAMEFVEGEDLQQRMRRSDSRLDWAEMARIMIGVGSALAAAHEKGLIHRDIKPSNVMIDKSAQVKVMDFGLAKATTGGNKSLTSAGLIMGTPNYLSPEQGRGDPLDGRSDLYSLGVVLYELLTGQLPFRADTPAGLIFKHVYEPPPPPGELNPAAPKFLVEICLKLLEKDPDDRYKSANEFLADMTEFFEDVGRYTDGGERRPGTGSDDQERVANSGAYASAAMTKRRPPERNAPTEEITRPARASALETEEERDARASARARRERERQKAEDDEHRGRPRPVSQRAPEAPRRSRAPLVLLLLLLAGGGGGYAWWATNPDGVRDLAKRLGVTLPVSMQPVASTTAIDSHAPVVINPPTAIPRGEPVAYMLPPNVIPEGVSANLEAPGHRYELRVDEEGRYPLGPYTLELSKSGYFPKRTPVQLKKREDGTGVLLDADGRDAVRVAPVWEAVRELVDAYKAGHSANAQGDLRAARAALERAARFDPAYAPADGGKSVSELLAEVDAAIQAAQRTDAGLQAELGLVRDHVAARRWRAARELLNKLLPRLPEGAPERTQVEAHLSTCESEGRRSDTLLAAFETDLRHGAHDAAQTKLDELRKADPEHPQLAAIELKLGAARTRRGTAMADAGRDPAATAAAAERLRLYVTEFGPEDAAAKQRLDELSGAVQVQEERTRRLAAVRQAVQDQKWQEARRLAVEFLKEETDNAEVQRLRSQAETELNRQAVNDTLRSLDAALVKGSLDDAITLLDRDAPSYAIERAALADLAAIKGRFGSSEHRDLVVQVDGDVAVVRGTWVFTIEVLGQPSRSVTAQHRLRMRRVTGGRWLVSELEVEGEPRVESR